MNCKKTEQLMSEYIDGCLDGSTRNRFAAHIAECSRCKASLEAMRSMVSSLSALSGSRSEVDCWSSVRREITARKPAKQWPVFLRPVIAVPSIAVVIFLSVFMFWTDDIKQPDSYNTATKPEYMSYISAHSRFQRQQTMQDPDVTFITAELEKASFTVNSVGR